MELTQDSLLLAVGLGLLGFVEPCTIGAHMLFLNGQLTRSPAARAVSIATFVLARVGVMSSFGGAIAVLGQRLIALQTGFWLVFGLLYLVLGLAVLSGADRRLRLRVSLAPDRWKAARSPVLQGIAFGFNIPACAAPILFAVMGSAAVSGSAGSGVVLMGAFAIALSLPLVPLSISPRLSASARRLADWLRPRRRVLGGIFVLLGLWSIWFGLFVDPADWSGR